MIPVRTLTLALIAAFAAAPLGAHAQENPTTPGAIPNPGSYQGSMELQRREQQQSYQAPQSQPSYPSGGANYGGGYGGGRRGGGGMAPGADIAAFQRGDYATAYRLTLPMAQGGNAVAQYNMGTLYAKGLGVRRDPAQAAQWFRRAALQGNAGAANDLAIAYASGNGVPEDYVQSYVWVSRAARFARSPADRNAILVNRRDLVAHMSAGQLAQAKAALGEGGGRRR